MQSGNLHLPVFIEMNLTQLHSNQQMSHKSLHMELNTSKWKQSAADKKDESKLVPLSWSSQPQLCDVHQHTPEKM